MSILSFTAYASNSGETLTVNAAWVDGELLRINVTDINGANSALALLLSDYVSSTENSEYISIQAVDLAGNKSGVIEIKNPFYDPNTAPVITVTPSQNEQEQISQSAVPNGSPFTPDGTGTVVDNIHDGDGKEFFTIGTEDGNVFYLIIDRHRNSDNVYFLNAVTEEDLISLARQGGREVAPSGGSSSISAIEPPEQPEQQNPADEQNQQATSASETPEPSEPDPPADPPEKKDNSMYLIIGAAVIAVGGAGYYFKIVKGKKKAAYDDDDEDDENDDYSHESEPEDNYEDDEDGGDD